MTAEKHPLETVWEALTLHHSMVLSGEYFSDTSENKYYAGLNTLTHYMGQTQSCAECERLGRENARLRDAMSEIREIYVGSEGGNPKTAYEGYLLQEQKKMYQVAVDGISKHAATIAVAGGE